ncbi:MAG: hypothetical protein EOP61_28500, partial [Sphingomonadales bacterium]
MDNLSRNFWRKLGAPLVALVGTLLICVVFLFGWLTLQQNRLSFVHEQRLASSAIDTRLEFFHRSLGDYAIWDDIVRNLIGKGDLEWADANVGPHLFQVQGYEYCFVLDDRGRTIYASARSERTSTYTARIADGVLDRLIESLRRMPGQDRRKVILTTIDGGAALLGAASIIPSSNRERMPRPHYLVFAKKLDPALLEPMSREYGLAGLRIAAPGLNGVPLINDSGRSIGTLVWEPANPGSELRRTSWPSLAILM